MSGSLCAVLMVHARVGSRASAVSCTDELTWVLLSKSVSRLAGKDTKPQHARGREFFIKILLKLSTEPFTIVSRHEMPSHGSSSVIGHHTRRRLSDALIRVSADRVRGHKRRCASAH